MIRPSAPAAIDEVTYFAARLRQQGLAPDAVVVNRVQPALPLIDEAQLKDAAAGTGVRLSPSALRSVLNAASDDRIRAGFEAEQLLALDSAMSTSAGKTPQKIRVPILSGDVHDVRALARVSRVLLGS